MTWRCNSISMDIDIDDILNQIPDDDIKEYVFANDLLSISDIDINNLIENDTYGVINAITRSVSDYDIFNILKAICNKGRSCQITYTKSEMKSMLNKIIDLFAPGN